MGTHFGDRLNANMPFSDAWQSTHDTNRRTDGVKIVELNFSESTSGDRFIDWGDGTREIRNERLPFHEYADHGVYIVRVWGGSTPIFGERGLTTNQGWTHTLKSVERIGRLFFSNTENAFQNVLSDFVIPDIPTGLYQFSSFTFTNGTQTGRIGPSLSNLLSVYTTANNDWLANTDFFDVSGGIQLWTVPTTGTYRMGAYGAGTNHVSNQQGAIMKGDFLLEEGEVIRILVGQQGTNFRCGSGGSFVVRDSQAIGTGDILVIAGGNGGYSSTNHAIMQGTTANNGQNSVTSTGGVGGSNGSGGGQGGACFAQSGAGFSGNGLGCDSIVAQSFLNGGVGALAGSSSGEGGFGGGGTGRSISNWRIGGGGGYSGGASAGNISGNAGGGGGSFNSGTDQDNQSGAHAGHGKVEIAFLG